jgi:hypothetical protein
MRRCNNYRLTILVATALCVATASLLAQPAPQPNPAPPPGQGSASVSGGPNRQIASIAQFTPEQQEKYNAAVRLFQAERFADAYGIFQMLLQQLSPATPSQIQVAKLAAESAINAGDQNFALETLKPLEAADSNDWITASLLARVYAETGQKQQRDAEIAHLVDLHQRAISPQIAKQQVFLLERIPIANGSIRIWYSLVPWGNFKTYIFSRVYDQAGQQVFRISLESGDFDQPLFAKQHPDLAAQGMRLFSLDGYGQPQKQPNGGATFTHMTFGFYNGQPSYDIIRERIIQIAGGQVKPMSQTEQPAPAKP